jgi:hypothetical protein
MWAREEYRKLCCAEALCGLSKHYNKGDELLLLSGK